MKVCLLSNINNEHTRKICRFLIAKNHQVHVISLSKGNMDGVNVYCFDKDNIKAKSDFLKLSYILNIFKIKKIIKQINPDILNAHYATSYGIIGSLAGFSPYILSVWGSDIYLFPKKSIFHKKLLQYNLRKADVILSTSNDMAKETKIYTDKDIGITPFGINTELFTPAPDYRFDDSNISIGLAKGLDYVYGIDYLIKAVHLVKQQLSNANITLHIAGSGKNEDQLKQLAKDLGLEDNIIFYGRINQSEVVKLYQTVDIACFPSLSESFGVSVLEAQACGKPVIVSDVGGLKETTIPDVTSLVVGRKNFEQLAKAILTLKNNPQLRQSMGTAGIDFVRKHFDEQKTLTLLENVYKQLVK